MNPLRRALAWTGRHLALLVIVAAVLWACVSIALNRAEESPPGVTVIRLGHWQLEAGVREAIDAMAADYAKIHPEVRIVQDAIPDQVFAQWANTQLVGGTAPDLIEAGGLMAPPLWLNLQRRYLLPLTDHFTRPNPYNNGTELAGVPLGVTLKGGNSPVAELQENMDLSLSRVSVRVFYNKTLLRRLTGTDVAPHDLAAFFDVCRRIQSQGYAPIVGSNYHFGMWEQLYNALTYSAGRRADYNHDGYLGNDEMFVGFRRGALGFELPAYRARFDLIHELSQFFQPGFAGLTREEGVLLFAQERAVFMSTGLWEARGIEELARGKFEVGVMAFPEPAPDDPAYGRFLEGPIYEDPRIVFGFSVPRTSQHPEIAVDFLLFMASRRQNEKLNRIIGWVPNVVGARTNPELAAFEPNLTGVYPSMDFNLSGDTTVRWKQLSDLYAIGQISYADLAAEFSDEYRERGAAGFAETRENWRRGLAQAEQLAATLRAAALAARDPGEADDLWMKYAALVSWKQCREVLQHAYLDAVLNGAAEPPPAGDEYSPRVLENVRARLRATPPPPSAPSPP